MADDCPPQILPEEEMVKDTTSNLNEYQREDDESEYGMIYIKLEKISGQLL